MATWGSESRSERSSRSIGKSTPALPRGGSSSSGSRSPGSKTSTAQNKRAIAARTADETAPTRRGDQARADLREAVSGREHEFIGIAFILGGLLVGLATYLKIAGILGRLVSDLLGFLTGLGQFVVPVALIATGIALIRSGKSQHRTRLVAGWGGLTFAMLGLLHVARARHVGITGNNNLLKKAGGLFGSLIAVPLSSLIGPVGAVILLLAIGLASVLLISNLSVRTLGTLVRTGVETVSVPVGRAAKRAVGDMSTLSSERLPELGAGTPATIYDVDAEERDFFPVKAPRAKKIAPPPPPAPMPTATVGMSAIEQPELDLGPAARRGNWQLPPASFLNRSGVQTINKEEVEARGRTLVDSLNSHGVETKLVGMTVGPTVTRYELELGSGVKVARVTSLNRDIAYAMAAIDVRILAPIPGRSAIGVEVPNHTRQLVSLGDIMSSAEAKTASHPLDVAVGKDIAGRSVFLNLGTTPHLLIAGATGAGKSSGINCIITSLLMRSTPDQVKLILIDPKQVEMGQYNKLPHLLTQPVTNPKKAANALQWACKEMDRRYDVLFEVGFRDIGGYNAAFDRGELQPDSRMNLLGLDDANGDAGPDRDPDRDPDGDPAGDPAGDKGRGADDRDSPGVGSLDSSSSGVMERMTYIVVVVDELNDLMMVAARDVEESITRIAQKARAVGIHLIIATQRPSVNVITGVIKANVPARMAFAVSSLTDSRVILDQPGAEKLVGKGDMLLLPGNSNVAQRIQGSFVSEEEVRKVVGFWRKQAPDVHYVSGVEGDEDGGNSNSLFGTGGGSSSGSSSGDDDDDELMRQAMELVVRSQLGSTSMLQRKLKIGFARAGRIMDLLEQGGVVGPSEGSKARAVLMTVDEYELIQENERKRRGGS
jgi:S-DNA-T family DNA segregation ATPase FtsK/SpoIIIE